MCRSNFCIGAGGVSIWERMFLGVSNNIITVAENQKPSVKELSSSGLINFIGEGSKLNINKIKYSFLKEYLNPFKSQTKIKDASKLIDGKGLNRILDLFCGSIDKNDIKFRKYKASDCKLLWEWANDQDVRKNAFNDSYIDYEDHKKWFLGKIKSENTKIYIFSCGFGFLGQVRFDKNDNKSYIDYSVSRQFRGYKLGEEMLRKSIDKYEKIFY